MISEPFEVRYLSIIDKGKDKYFDKVRSGKKCYANHPTTEETDEETISAPLYLTN